MAWKRIKETIQHISPLTLAMVVPYAWYILFLLVPLLLVLKISVCLPSETDFTYQKLIQKNAWHDIHIILSLGSYITILKNSFYLTAFKNSLSIAFLSTFVCLVLGYPMAYAISRSRHAILWLALSVIPFFASFLIRIYAWIQLIGTHGIINQMITALGMKPIAIMHTQYAVVLAMVYSYLPFMIFPIYSALIRIDDHLLESAQDLGCRPMAAFWRILLPLSIPGILSGIIFVFIPVMSEYLIPEILGGDRTIVMGRLLWAEFFTIKNWPTATALSIILILVSYLPAFICSTIRRHFYTRIA